MVRAIVWLAGVNIMNLRLFAAAAAICSFGSTAAYSQSFGTNAQADAFQGLTGGIKSPTYSATPSSSASESYNGSDGSSSAAASASLAEGSLKSISTSSGNAGASSIAAIRDTLTFDLGSASANGVFTPLTFIFTFNGQTTFDETSVSYARGLLEIGSATSSNVSSIDLTLNKPFFGTGQDNSQKFTALGTGFASFDTVQIDQYTWRATAVYNMPQAFASALQITSSLHTISVKNATTDFSHTALVNVVAPTGVSFTSASGQFLSAAPIAAGVPEPSTWAMMLLGFGFVGGVMRSAKRRGEPTVSYS